jgi:hypothetical protein
MTIAARTMKLNPNPNRLWQAPQVRMFVKEAIDCVGPRGWDYLSCEMREALIAKKALVIATGLERGDVPCAAIGCLHRDMLRVAGLLDDE